MYDMTFEWKSDKKICLYEQIYEHIRDEIKEGKLLCGEKLPSTRALAEYLQVARSTVEYAYEQLLSEGYIEAVPYKGYYVCKLEELYDIRQEASDFSVEHQKEETVHEFDFSPNGIDMSAFPYSVWKKINRAILTDNNADLFRLGNPQGEEGLRNSITRYLYASRGISCSPGQIIIGAGNDYLLMLLEKILGREVRIAMESPTYKRAWQIFDSFAYHIVTVGMDAYGMRVEELEKSEAAAAYVMPSHQYPTGIVMPIGRRSELLKWAGRKPERYIIEDDYDSEFRYKGKPIPALMASDREDKVIYIGTFSKAIAPAIRISYMVLPGPLMKQFRQNCYFYSSTVSRIDQTVLQHFIDEGYFERYLNKMRKLYKAKHDFMLERLKPFYPRFQVSGENAGLHILLTDKKQEAEKDLLTKAANQGVRVYGLSEGQQGGLSAQWLSGTVILGYGGLSREEIKEGLLRLEKAWL